MVPWTRSSVQITRYCAGICWRIRPDVLALHWSVLLCLYYNPSDVT
jgi:hypothetical protein